MDCHVSCTAELSGGCEVQCQSPDGALFCDGQYVDHGGNLEECIAALNAFLDIEVSGSASCSGNSCEAEASASCSAAPAQPLDDDLAPWLTLAFAAGLVGLRRRR